MKALRHFLLLGFAAFSVARASATGDGRVVVNYWEKWTGFEADAMRTVVDEFNRAQDRIEVRFLSVSQIDVKLMLATSGGNPPDVAGLWSHSVTDFSEKGALTPLDGALARAHVGADRFVPVFWELCRHRGFTWALPVTPACIALFYNKKMFREAGLDPDRPPRTMAELAAMNARLTAVEVERAGERATVAFAALTPEERAAHRFTLIRAGHLPQEPGWYREMWGYWFGAELYDGGRSIAATHPGNIAAFTWFRQTAQDLGVENLRLFGSTFGTMASPQNPFLGGTVAMVLQGPWMTNFIEKYAPGLEWGVAAFPAADGVAGGAPVTVVESDVVVIPCGAPHPREAFEFILYLQRQDVAEKLALGQRKFTALRAVSPAFLAQHPNPAIGFFVELSRSSGARFVPRLAMWREYKEELLVAADEALNLRQTPEAALAVAQARVQRRLDRAVRRWDVVGAKRLEEWRQRDAEW
jgi:ABC-type glycerol-3-phosphate transport system substrate-binding protein